MWVIFLYELMQHCSSFLMLVCRTEFLEYLFIRKQYLSAIQRRSSEFLVHCKSKSVFRRTSLWFLWQIISVEEDSEQTPAAWVWQGATSAVSALSSQDQAELGPSAAHETTSSTINPMKCSALLICLLIFICHLIYIDLNVGGVQQINF